MDESSMPYQKEVFRPLRTKRAFEEISTEIKRLIFQGILKPGDTLPTEADLAVKFGISRHTIREALRILEVTGVIKIQRGGTGGAVVVDTISHSINSLFLDAIEMRSITKQEIITGRVKIEKAVLEEAIDRADNGDIQKLEENLSLERAIYKKNLDSFEKNIEFHRLLAKASKNHLFVIVMEALLAVVTEFRSRDGLDIETARQATEEHAEIIQAIKERDRERACMLLEKHLLECCTEKSP